MNFKQGLAYMAFGCLFTLAGYFLTTVNVGVFNPQDAFAQDAADEIVHENIPSAYEIMSDLIGRTVYIGGLDSFHIISMEEFGWFSIADIKTFRHIVEYRVKINLIDDFHIPEHRRKNKEAVQVLLHVAYRKTDTGWKLVSASNLRE